jgi:hypothetical protein
MFIQAYNTAKEEMIAGTSTWNQCCEKSGKMANLSASAGIWRQAKTISNGSMSFARDSRNMFRKTWRRRSVAMSSSNHLRRVRSCGPFPLRSQQGRILDLQPHAWRCNLKNCVDCLKLLYPDLFDHWSGNAKRYKKILCQLRI